MCKTVSKKFTNNRMIIETVCLGQNILCFFPSIIINYASFNFSKCLSINYDRFTLSIDEHYRHLYFKAWVMPWASRIPLHILIFFAGDPKIGAFSYTLCWYHAIYLLRNQFSPPLFFLLHRCSDPFHFSLLLFITDETREKKYYMWRTCKDYRNVVNPYKILLKSYHCCTVPSVW